MVLDGVHLVVRGLVVRSGAGRGSWKSAVLVVYLTLHGHVAPIAQCVDMSFLSLEHYTLHHGGFVVLEVGRRVCES